LEVVVDIIEKLAENVTVGRLHNMFVRGIFLK